METKKGIVMISTTRKFTSAILSVALVFGLTACNNNTVEEKITEFKNSVTTSSNNGPTNPGFANVVHGDRKTIDDLLSSVRIGAEASPKEYHRADWKPSKTRMHVWNKDFTKKWSYRDWSGTFSEAAAPFNAADPTKTFDLYTNQVIDMNDAQYDHIIPLKYANDHGASNWSNEKKVLYATSLDVALTVDGHENMAKGAKGPSKYMPEKNKDKYAFTWLLIAVTWDLSLDQADYDVIKETLKDVNDVNRINLYIEQPYFK